ncbi:MAG: peptidase M15 [Bacteroidetes bacterium]|nr:MAG: peptidase M15 [Bacteroidota bacterium]
MLKPAKLSLNKTLFLLLAAPMACAPSLKQLPKNNYGLLVIAWKKTYKQQVKADAASKLVSLNSALLPFQSNLYYARTDNFTQKILYKKPILYLNVEAAQKLAVAQKSLLAKGYNLLIFDAYRPYAVTQKMWTIVPDDRYAANPASGSGHNRGAAVDLTLTYASTGAVVTMPTQFDNFSDTAHHGFSALPDSVIAHRELLRKTMEEAGFKALGTEWWHYSLPNTKQYPIYDLSFKQLRSLARRNKQL